MPGEIRNKIWKYVTEDLIVLVHGDREWTHLFACSDWTPTSTKRIFRLPQVCRQIYQDTCLLLYAQTMFLHHFDKTIFEWEWKEPLDPTQFALSLAQKKAIANATPMMVGSPNEYLRFLPLFPNVSRIHMDKRWRELISEKWGGFDKICWYEEWSRWPRRYMMKESDIYHILRGRDRCAYRFIKHLDLEDLDWGRIGENEERSRYRELSKVVNSYLKDHKMDWESCV